MKVKGFKNSLRLEILDPKSSQNLFSNESTHPHFQTGETKITIFSSEQNVKLTPKANMLKDRFNISKRSFFDNNNLE